MSRRCDWLLGAVLVSVIAACGGTSVNDGGPGAGREDAGQHGDAGIGSDAGAVDAGGDLEDADAGVVDAGLPDAGQTVDAGTDAGEELVPDAGEPDAGTSGEPDAGQIIDAGIPDAGSDAGIDAGVPDAGSVAPTILGALPLFGPYGTQVQIVGDHLRRGSTSLTLAGRPGALRPDGGDDVRWTESEIRFNHPFPAAGPMVLRTSAGTTDAGAFIPDWLPFPFSPSSTSTPGLYDGDQLIETWVEGNGQLSAAFQGAEGVRVLTWTETSGVVEELELAPASLRLQEVSLRTEGGLSGGAAIGLTSDGGTALYVLQVGPLPQFVSTGYHKDVLGDFVASGSDSSGEFAWVHQPDAGFLRIRNGTPAWSQDLGPVTPPAGFRHVYSGGRVLPNGGLAVSWPKDRSNFFFTLNEPHFAILPAGSSTFGADETVAGPISGYLVKNHLRASSDGRISLKYCGGYISWILFPFPFPVPTITGCHLALRSSAGTWRGEPAGLEQPVSALALTPGSLTVADCSSDGLRTHALATTATAVPSDRDAGEFSIWPCPEVHALEVDGEGNRLALVEDNGRLYVPRKNPAAVRTFDPVCTPRGFDACDADDALYCNPQGSGTRLVACGDFGCNPTAGRCKVVAASNLPGDVCATPGTEDLDVPSLETVTLDTTNAASCTAVVPQSNGVELCLKKYRNVSVGFSGNGELRVVGSRPLALVATRDLYVDGVITTEAGRGTAGTGANGGCVGCGAGGGTYGSGGGTGGALAGGNGNAAAGPINGTEALSPLIGGSPGGKGGTGAGGAGGAGGGALQLFACNRLTVTSDADISASGRGGTGGGGGSFLSAQAEGGGGGGSGGAILLEGTEVVIESAGLVTAHGGGGGGGGGATGSFPAGATGESGASGTGVCTAYGGTGGNANAGSGGAGATGCTTAPITGGNAATANNGAGGGGGGLGRIRINSRKPAQSQGSVLPEPTTGTLGTD